MKNTALLSIVFAAAVVPMAAFAGTISGFVVAGSDGKVIRGTGYQVTHFATGQYEIDTIPDVHSCAYSVTAGSGDTTVPAPAIATAVGRRENHTAVMVATYGLDKQYADAGFHLIVQCAGTTPGGAAVVDPDGTLVRGVFANSATRTGTGAYTVTFANSVLASTCAYTAGIGLSGTLGVSDPGFVNVASGGGGTIVVRTYDTHGNATDLGFHVYAACAL